MAAATLLSTTAAADVTELVPRSTVDLDGELASLGLEGTPKVHQVGHSVSVDGLVVARLDYTRLLPRTFDIDVQHFTGSAGPYQTGWLEMEVTPQGPDETASSFLLPSRAFTTLLHLAPGEGIQVNVDAAHKDGFLTQLVPDTDGDGVQDTLVVIPHFSMVWFSVAGANSRSLYDVWGESSTNIWAVGDHTVWHYDGTWTDVTPSGLGPGSLGIISTVRGGSYPGEILVAGDVGKLWRHDSSGWTSYSNPWGVSDPTKVAIRASASDGGTIYFAGYDENCATPCAFFGTYAYGQFTRIPTNRLGALTSISVENGEVWMSGARASSGFMLRYSGSFTEYTTYEYITQADPFPPLYSVDHTNVDGGALAGSLDGDIFTWRADLNRWQIYAVGPGNGQNSQYWHWTAETSTPGLTWFAGCQGCGYITKAWPYQLQSATIGTSQYINGMHAFGAHDVWAVGHSGLVLHYLGGTPSPGSLVSPVSGANVDIGAAVTFSINLGGMDPDLDDVTYTFYIQRPNGVQEPIPGCSGINLASCLVAAESYPTGTNYKWNVQQCTWEGAYQSCSWLASPWRPFTFVQAPVITYTAPNVLGAWNDAKTITGTYTLTGTIASPGGPVSNVKIQIKAHDSGHSKNGQYWNEATKNYQVTPYTPALTLSGPSGGPWTWSYTFTTAQAFGGVHQVRVTATGSGITVNKDAYVDAHNVLQLGGGLWTELRSGTYDFSPSQPLLDPTNAFPSAVINFDWETPQYPNNLGVRVQGDVKVPDGTTYQLYTKGGLVGYEKRIDGNTASTTFVDGDLFEMGSPLAAGRHTIYISGGTYDRFKLYWAPVDGSGNPTTTAAPIPPQNLFYAPKDRKSVDMNGNLINPDGWVIQYEAKWTTDHPEVIGVPNADPDLDGIYNKDEYTLRNFGHRGEFYYAGTPWGGPLQADLVLEVMYTENGNVWYRPDPAGLDYIRKYFNSDDDNQQPIAGTGPLPPEPLPTIGGDGIRVHIVVNDEAVADTPIFDADSVSPDWTDFRQIPVALPLSYGGIIKLDGEEDDGILGVASGLIGAYVSTQATVNFAADPNYQGPWGWAAPQQLPPVAASKVVALHEIGHTLGAGLEDDEDCNNDGSYEIYSGDHYSWAEATFCGTDDTMPEEKDVVVHFENGWEPTVTTSKWSVMAKGTTYNARVAPEFQTAHAEGGNDETGLAVEWGTTDTYTNDYPYSLTYKWSVENQLAALHTMRRNVQPTILTNLLTGPSELGPGGNILQGVPQAFTAVGRDEDGGLVTIGFDWGDGTHTQLGTEIPIGSVGQLTHTWTTPGTYTVRPFAIDQEGAMSAPLVSITVNVVSNFPPSVAAQVDGPLVLNGPGTFTSSTLDLDGDPAKFTFDWGDGTTTTTDWVLSGDVASASHDWTSPGTYYVTTYATDPSGVSGALSNAVCVLYGPGTQADACDPNIPANVGDAPDDHPNARTIAVGRSYPGRLDSNAGDLADEYVVPVQQGDILRVRLTTACCTSLAYELYAPDGTPVDARPVTPDAEVPEGGGTIQLQPLSTMSVVHDYSITALPTNVGGNYYVKVTGCDACGYSFRISRGPLALLLRPSAATAYVNDVPQDPAPVWQVVETPPAPVSVTVGAGASKYEGCIQPYASYFIEGVPPLPPPLDGINLNNLLTSNKAVECLHTGPTVIQGDLTICGTRVENYEAGLAEPTWYVLEAGGASKAFHPTALYTPKCWLWPSSMVPPRSYDISFAVRDANGDVWGVTKQGNVVIPP